MAINLGSAYGKVSLDTKGFMSGITTAKGGINSLVESGAKLKMLGTALTLAVSVPLIAGAKNALMAASAMNETKNKVKVVFKEMSDDVLEWSKNSAMAFGQSQQQALAATATFGNLFVTMDIGVEKAAEMSMKLVELASDLASFNDIDPSVALEKLRAGLVGEAEPLRTVGIRISEVEVNAQALRMGLVELEVDMVSVNGATLNLRVAQEELRDVIKGEVVDTDKLRNAQSNLANASEGVADAQGRVAKAQLAVLRAQRDLNALLADPKIEKDSLRIIHARERVADAEQRVLEVQEKVGDATEKVSEATRKLSDARKTERPEALDIAVAEQKVAEAQQSLQAAMAGTNVELTEQQKLLARYGVIMEQSAVAQGDFQRTAFDFANSLRTLKAVWGDTLVVIGDFFLPLATKVVHILTKMLDAFNKLTPFQQKIIVGFFTLVAVIGPLLIVIGFLLPMLGHMTKSMNPLSGSIFGLVFSFVKLISALAIVVKILAFFGIATGPIGAGILALNTAIIGTAGSLLAALAPVLIVIAAIAIAVGILYLMWKYNIFGMRDVFNNALAVIKRMWQAFMAFWRGDTEEGLAIVGELFADFRENITRIFDFSKFTQAWTNFMNWIRNALTTVRNYISTAFTNVKWGDVGKFILLGIANGMLMGLPNLLMMAKKVIDDLIKTFDTQLDAHSPSGLFEKRGIWSGQGYLQGLNKSMNPDDMARSLMKPITNNSNSQSQTIVQNFASGLSLKQVRGEIDARVDALANEIIMNLGGA